MTLAARSTLPIGHDLVKLVVVAGLSVLTFGGASTSAGAAEWFVSAGGSGSGTEAAPFGRIRDALESARAGDVIIVGPGTFNERLMSVRSGTDQAPITVRSAQGRGSSIVTASGRVLTVGHAYLTFSGLVLDGQYGNDDLIRVSGAATGFTLRNTEVRRSGRDAVDLGAVQDAVIDGSLIHHALNSTNGRTDAHGIAGGAVRHLIIRNTEINTFSGDAIQVDSARASPGWTDVLIEGCRLWLAPLATAANGFDVGVVPGENAIDTKASRGLPRARIIIRNTQAWGFRNGLIANMAAFNIKDNVDAVVDGATVFNSEIAFRLRAPATVRVQNTVVHTVSSAFRYEDNIQGIRIWNTTLGGGIAKHFDAAASPESTLDVRNVLVLGRTLPAEARGPSNLAVPESAFVNASARNYELSGSSPAVDAGTSITEIGADRIGTPRPQGLRYDIGAYERVHGIDLEGNDGRTAGRTARRGRRRPP